MFEKTMCTDGSPRRRLCAMHRNGRPSQALVGRAGTGGRHGGPCDAQDLSASESCCPPPRNLAREMRKEGRSCHGSLLRCGRTKYRRGNRSPLTSRPVLKHLYICMYIFSFFLLLLRACSRKDQMDLCADSTNYTPVCSLSRPGSDGLRVAAAVCAVAFLSVKEI